MAYKRMRKNKLHVAKLHSTPLYKERNAKKIALLHMSESSGGIKQSFFKKIFGWL